MYKLYSNIICSIAFSYFCCDIVHGGSSSTTDAMVVYKGISSAIQIKSKEDAARILSVDVNASRKEIKKAYRRLARLYHPDKGGDTAIFQQLNAACAMMTGKDTLQLTKSRIQEVHNECWIELIKRDQRIAVDELTSYFNDQEIIQNLSNNLEYAIQILNLCERKLYFLQSKNRKQEFFNKTFGMDKYPVIKKETDKLFQISYSLEDGYYQQKNKQLEEAENQANKIAYQSKLRLLAERSQELSWHSKIAIFGKKEKQCAGIKSQTNRTSDQSHLELNKKYQDSHFSQTYNLDSVAHQIFCKSNKKEKEKIKHEKLDKKIQDIDNQLCKARLGSIATVGAVSSLGLVITGIMLRYKNS